MNKLTPEEFNDLCESRKVVTYERDNTVYILDITDFKHPGPILDAYISNSVTDAFNYRQESVHKGVDPLKSDDMGIKVVGTLITEAPDDLDMNKHPIRKLFKAANTVAKGMFRREDPADMWLNFYQENNNDIIRIGLDNRRFSLWDKYKLSKLLWKHCGPVVVVKSPTLATKIFNILKVSVDTKCPFMGNSSTTQAISKMVGVNNIFYPQDPDSHQKLRNILIDSFRNKDISGWIQPHVDVFVKCLKLRHGVDNLKAYVDRLTSNAMVTAFFGPQEDLKMWHDLIMTLKEEFDNQLPPNVKRHFRVGKSAQAALEEISTYVINNKHSENSLLYNMEKAKFSEEECVQMVQMLLIVGHGNLSSALTSTVYALSKYSNWHTKIQEAEFSFEEGFSRDFFFEVMRLFPPVWIMARKARQPFEIDNLKVSVGTTFLISQLGNGRDEKVYRDAGVFDPMRFTDKPDPVHPFSIGLNHCPGQYLAKQVIKQVVDSLKGDLMLMNKEFLHRHPKLKGGVALGFNEPISVKLVQN